MGKKIVLSLICLMLISLCGCAAWYQQGKTLMQATKDCDECMSYSFHLYPIFEVCMEERGYSLKTDKWLHDRNIPIQEASQRVAGTK